MIITTKSPQKMTIINILILCLLLGHSSCEFALSPQHAIQEDSNEITSSDNQAPSTPENLNNGTIQSNSYQIEWDASTDNVAVAGYHVYRDGSYLADSVSNSYTDTTVDPDTDYTYQVSAYDAAENESGRSDSVAGTTPEIVVLDIEAPSKPENLSSGTLGPNNFPLSWDASTDNVGVTGYYIYRNGLYLAESSAIEYIDMTVSEDTEYTYQVYAFDEAGNVSDPSDPLTERTPEVVPDTEAPTVPSGLNAESIQPNRVSLSWNASTDNTGVTGYRIYRGGSAIGTCTGTTYSDSTVDAGMTYNYTVAAYDAAGNQSAQSGSIEVTTPTSVDDPRVMDHRFTDASTIPDAWIAAVKSSLHIAYQHTSHGSQIPSGMNTLEAYPDYGNRYQWSEDGSEGLDLDKYDPIMSGYHDLSTEDSEDASGNTPWANATRTFLDNTSNYHINVVIWSWCSINGHDIDRYITNMERLIAEYGLGGTDSRASDHPVEFVFMTGHTQGQGEDGFVAQAAAQIRAHCVTNNRWLIDYYDIECYDPDGNYFGDLYIDDNLSYSGGNWAVEYLGRHDGEILDILTTGQGVDGFSGCTDCAHSEEVDGYRQSTLNCVLKGQAAWHLFARIAGWDGN